MAASFQPDTDLSCMDGLETVSLRLSQSTLPVAVVGALRRRIESREAEASGGRYLAGDVDWHLPSAALTVAPAIGSVLIDQDGTAHTILRIERATLGTRFVCHSRSLSISGDLDRLITIERATWTKDANGVATPQWSALRSDLAARIQPEVGTIGVDQDRRLTRVTHRIYLAEAVAVDQDHRAVAGGEVYRVLGFEQLARIDALCCLLVEQVDGALGFFGDSSEGAGT
jgi:head-tail adaptor